MDSARHKAERAQRLRSSNTWATLAGAARSLQRFGCAAPSLFAAGGGGGAKRCPGFSARA
jgi:hypothetical protein